MRNNYRILLSLFFLGVGLLDGKAASLTEKVQETYRKTDQFKADFIQKTFVEVLGRELEEKGEIVFSKPSRFFIHYRGGRERKLISDGKTLWIVYPQEKEVEVYEELEGLLSKEALVFLGGLGEMTKEFKVREISEKLLELIPKSSKALFVKLYLKVEPGTYLANEVVLFPRTGNKTHYFFSSLRLNEPVPEGIFHFRESGFKFHRPLE